MEPKHQSKGKIFSFLKFTSKQNKAKATQLAVFRNFFSNTFTILNGSVKRDSVRRDSVRRDPVRRDPVRRDPVRRDPVRLGFSKDKEPVVYLDCRKPIGAISVLEALNSHPSNKRPIKFGMLALAILLSFSSVGELHAGDATHALPAIVNLLLEPDQPPAQEAICRQASGTGVINLSTRDETSSASCLSSPQYVDSCLVLRIKQALSTSCRKNIDVFVPGTNAEDGSYEQFESLIDDEDNRGFLSLRYETEGLLPDGLRYDDGVISIAQRLPLLLKAIQEEFDPDSVRVYGHSKGSHGVALVADKVLNDSDYDNFKFFAFGQAKRTAVDISSTEPGIVAGRLGSKGYIQKLSDNLVGITWSNDEVHYYEGSGTNGLKVPDRWLHAGRINDTSTGGVSLQTTLRIDHHDTYGRKDPKSNSFPYCATGRYASMDGNFPKFLDQCGKVSSEPFLPYFWGDSNCKEIAWDMIEGETANPASVWIGSSGPRASSGCKEDLSLYSAKYKLVYRYNRADSQCRYNIKIAFNGLNGRPGGGEIVTSASDGNTFQTKTKSGSVNIPPHMRLQVTAWLTEQDTEGPFGITRKCSSLAQTESYIDFLEVTFDSPTQDNRTFRLIGNDEGSDYANGVVTDKDLSGWKKGSGDWRMEYDTILDTLKIEGKTTKGAEGNFTKIIHLID